MLSIDYHMDIGEAEMRGIEMALKSKSVERAQKIIMLTDSKDALNMVSNLSDRRFHTARRARIADRISYLLEKRRNDEGKQITFSWIPGTQNVADRILRTALRNSKFEGEFPIDIKTAHIANAIDEWAKNRSLVDYLTEAGVNVRKLMPQ